jgi:hypothetical protein
MAQAVRKPGLWQLTTTTTWQQSPFPASMQPSGEPQTTNVCLTQEIIDKYGAPMPSARSGCAVSNVVVHSHDMTADWVCSGHMSGKGSLESAWTDDGHAKGKLHFVGSVQGSSGVKPIEFITNSTSVFKSSDCGDVKPAAAPPTQ